MRSPPLRSCYPKQDTAAAIVKAGGIKPLVGVLTSGTDGGQIHAAATLAAIADGNAEFQLQIVNAGAITPLVTLVRMGSQRAQTYAAAAIASISEDPQHKEPIIKTGAILPLVRLVRNTAAIDAQVQQLRIANLSSKTVLHRMHLRSGGLSTAVGIARERQDPGSCRARYPG